MYHSISQLSTVLFVTKYKVHSTFFYILLKTLANNILAHSVEMKVCEDEGKVNCMHQQVCGQTFCKSLQGGRLVLIFIPLHRFTQSICLLTSWFLMLNINICAVKSQNLQQIELSLTFCKSEHTYTSFINNLRLYFSSITKHYKIPCIINSYSCIQRCTYINSPMKN